MHCRLHRRKCAGPLLLLAVALLGGGGLLLLLLLSGSSSSSAADGSRIRDLRGSPRDMRLAAYANNARQPLLNAELFPGPPRLVLAVQARGGAGAAARLRPLLESLRRAEEPGRLLLIVSMGRPSVEAAALLRSVRFCPVLQLFFPYSLSFYPAEFPGPEPGCGAARRCRDAAAAQEKHHWWWKLRFVWEKVRALGGYDGPVLFLPDDAYLLPDFARVLRLLEALREPGGAELLSLGPGPPGPLPADLSGARAERGAWDPARHRGAVALHRELYYALMGCLQAFCSHGDRRWERSLRHVAAAACLPRPLTVLSPLLPRLLLPPCEGCEPQGALRARLFPASLSLQSRPPSPEEEEGGWDDARDQALCKAYAKL
ncbi:alpha-1,6-mannosyl-glycoprotein 2-beta-N-acetylglucosaminyltransferase-like [Rhinatrema bivittatum]|uniref:alpha-1,6-mannosyl-glycoprotein 2-beta-N-acetylglucosaminyltransferase-like n=1 Tax=Rhinatrema bivittatum TaxID=194408 RepID=UPI00112DB40A|nr:alpha-1,6-mannosyl-glycoprotein 2-beta-N-acetylglucosaminyltransferase-like [Rhinatrema bivittatum]